MFLVLGAGAQEPAAPASPTPPPAAEVTPATAPPRAAEPAPDISTRPADPRASKVYTVLETFCARCHQAGKLEKSEPAGGFGNVLAVDELARDASLVIPGTPDASPLYDLLLARHAPLNVFDGGGEGKEPSPEDLDAVRIWIRDMPVETAQCPDRQPIKTAAIETFIDEALRVAREGASELRFISLAELYNTCATVAEIATARQAVTKILNSLSWAPAAHKVNVLDPDGTLLSFRLSEYGWVGAHWEALQRAYPPALVMPLRDKLSKAAGTSNPILRGDWLAEAVRDPKLYAQLLGLPPKLADLGKMNGVDVTHNIRIGRARRAVIRSSQVTRGNRLAERHPGTRGAFWIIRDFASSSGDQDLFEHPLGPKSAGISKVPFKEDLVRVQFALPNGFLAYALYDAGDARLDSVLPGVVKPEYAGTSETLRAGAQCFACHGDGIKPMRDEYRAQAGTITPPVSKEVEAALQLSAADGEMVLLRDADNERYRNALVAAGIDPQLKWRGSEITAALARRFRAGADFYGVAAELWLEKDVLAAALAQTSGANAILAQRLRHEKLDRRTLDPLLAYLRGAALPAPQSAAASSSSAAGERIGLKMWLEKPKPAIGDLIAMSGVSDTDCYLTVMNVDSSGAATVIFPNDFEPDNLVSAGKPFRVPAAEAPYQLRRKEAGRELVVAQCSTSPAPPTGVEHEFARQRFTVLGNWENFVRDALITDADLRSSPEKAARARRAAAQSRRNSGERGREREDTAPGRQLLDGRATVIID